MKKLILIAASIFFALSLSVAPVAALDIFPTCANSSSDPACALKDNSLQQGSPNFAPKNLINTALYILVGICIIVIVVAAIRITISNGDTNAVTSGKNAILYAVIGLAVAVLSYAIVNFVVAKALK